MKSAWEEVQPKNIYRVAKQLPLKDRGQEALLYLYQPIVGSLATNLYLSLSGEVKELLGVSEVGSHSDLLTDCDFGIQQFYEARLRLEGIGLLTTYYKVDPQVGKTFLYQLQEPLSPELFFKDNLLVFLLQEKISQKRFKQLLQHFAPKKVETEGYQEITKSFNEVFQFQKERFSADLENLQKIDEDFQITNEKAPIVSETFDWEFLTDYLQRQGLVVEFSEEVKSEILTFHTLYAIDEFEMAEFLAKTANITKSEIDLKELRKYLRQIYRKKQEPAATPVPEKAADLSLADQQTFRYNSLQLEGFSDYEVNLLKEMDEYPPMTYLEALKAAKSSFVSEPETWVVRDLVQKSGLPSNVINFLMHYLLVVQKKSVLDTFSANKAAAEWAEEKLYTPEAALIHVRKKTTAQAEKNQTYQQPRNKSTKRPVRKERIPEWMAKKATPAEAQLSPEKQAELDQKLASFLKEGE
ncbi:replication initiation and membrane attachment protein [Enterococcus sp. PF1-24]|uniref:replication initiation and membrane attachment family protein n=1 Tax=unclassified Enterococcus TaxID=2608891 RepID=UPI0024745534|nr:MULTISPECIES: DnaD domain protein [unclassified Enterococcus]MDH6364206.1 replication initiation and membrane attachment protein [Enterococcus sp. PFB1-1]MDH6401307.1 replication initiation and membrane attachment protein [Enterococcus sp. PF1-24]